MTSLAYRFREPASPRFYSVLPYLAALIALRSQ